MCYVVSLLLLSIYRVLYISSKVLSGKVGIVWHHEGSQKHLELVPISDFVVPHCLGDHLYRVSDQVISERI